MSRCQQNRFNSQRKNCRINHSTNSLNYSAGHLWSGRRRRGRSEIVHQIFRSRRPRIPSTESVQRFINSSIFYICLTQFIERRSFARRMHSISAVFHPTGTAGIPLQPRWLSKSSNSGARSGAVESPGRGGPANGPFNWDWFEQENSERARPPGDTSVLATRYGIECN